MEPGPPKKRQVLGVIYGRSSSISTIVLPSITVVSAGHITTQAHRLDSAGRDGTRPSKKTAGSGFALWKVEFHLDQRPTQHHRCRCWAHNYPSTQAGLRWPGWNPALQRKRQALPLCAICCWPTSIYGFTGPKPHSLCFALDHTQSCARLHKPALTGFWWM